MYHKEVCVLHLQMPPTQTPIKFSNPIYLANHYCGPPLSLFLLLSFSSCFHFPLPPVSLLLVPPPFSFSLSSTHIFFLLKAAFLLLLNLRSISLFIYSFYLGYPFSFLFTFSICFGFLDLVSSKLSTIFNSLSVILFIKSLSSFLWLPVYLSLLISVYEAIYFSVTISPSLYLSFSKHTHVSVFL